MSNMNIYSCEVNYNNCPDVFVYYFRAKSKDDVSKATGIPASRFNQCTRDEIHTAHKLGRHIDTVVRGRLIESGV